MSGILFISTSFFFFTSYEFITSSGRERERERKRECVCVCEREGVCVCVCVSVRKKDINQWRQRAVQWWGYGNQIFYGTVFIEFSLYSLFCFALYITDQENRIELVVSRTVNSYKDNWDKQINTHAYTVIKSKKNEKNNKEVQRITKQ